MSKDIDPRKPGACIIHGPDSPLVKAMNEALAKGEEFKPGPVQSASTLAYNPMKYKNQSYSRHERTSTDIFFSDPTRNAPRSTPVQDQKPAEPAIPTYADAINKAMREVQHV